MNLEAYFLIETNVNQKINEENSTVQDKNKNKYALTQAVCFCWRYPKAIHAHNNIKIVMQKKETSYSPQQ